MPPIRMPPRRRRGGGPAPVPVSTTADGKAIPPWMYAPGAAAAEPELDPELPPRPAQTRAASSAVHFAEGVANGGSGGGGGEEDSRGGESGGGGGGAAVHHSETRHRQRAAAGERAQERRESARDRRLRKAARARGAPPGLELDPAVGWLFAECPRVLRRAMVGIVGEGDPRRDFPPEQELGRVECERLLHGILVLKLPCTLTERQFDKLRRVNDGQRVRWMQHRGRKIDPNTMPPGGQRRSRRGGIEVCQREARVCARKRERRCW